MLNAVGYTRFSTDRQTENSTKFQKDAITEYANKKNINLLRFYSDEGWSGTNTERPAFQDMCAAANMGLFNAVLIYDISRASRDVADWMEFRKIMRTLNIQVISVTQNLGDALDPDSYLMELLNAGLGQHMVLQTRQKSIAGTTAKAKEGAFLGGYAPLGYNIKNGSYVINEYEANFVRTIFKMYAAGKSYNEIIDSLGGLKGKRGAVIGKTQLKSILQNERYIGVYTWNKRQYKVMNKWAGGKLNPNIVRIEGAIPQLIDIDTWERVQIRMKDKKRNATNKAKRTYLLSGLITCECCGGTYVGHTSTNSKGYQTIYYTCGTKYRNHTCAAKNIPAIQIEEFVMNQVKEYIRRMDFNREAEQIMSHLTDVGADVSAERKELMEITSKIENGVRAILNGLVMPELQEEMDRLRIRKSELEEIIAHAENKIGRVNKELLIAHMKKTADELESNPAAAIKELVKIYAHADGSCTVNIGVHLKDCGDEHRPICATFIFIPSISHRKSRPA